jgi:hypothetical protein
MAVFSHYTQRQQEFCNYFIMPVGTLLLITALNMMKSITYDYRSSTPSIFEVLQRSYSSLIAVFFIPSKIELENSFREHDRMIIINTQKAGIAIL